MTYKGTEYHSDVDGKSIKLMHEQDNDRTIKLKEERKFQTNEKQQSTQNNRKG